MFKLRNALSKIKYDYEYTKLSKRFDNTQIPLFKIIEIETLNRCNGKCAFCPVNVNQPQRPYAKMTDELFQKIIDELCELQYNGIISLYSNNEPFLDDRIVNFAKDVRIKLPKAFINLATNGSLLTKEKVDTLYGVLDLCVIDNYSTTNEINDNLINVIDYINRNNLCDVFKLVMRDQREVLTTRGGEAPNRKGHHIETVKHGCFYPFIQMVVRPDGKCSLCCNDALGKITLGDVNNQTLLQIWNSNEYKIIRDKLKSNGRSAISICKYCDSMFNAYAFEKHRRRK